jgi:uncharacterized protein (TIGR02246 family)
MRRLLLILSFLLLAATPAAAQPAADGPAEIKAVIARMQDAWNRGDFRGYMDGFWNPGVKFVSKGRMLTGWQDTLDHYIRDYDTPAKRGTLRFWDVEVEMLGPDVAQMTGRYKLDSQGLAQDGVNTRLFRRIDGRWVIALNHVSSREPAFDAVAEAEAIKAVMTRQVAAWNAGDIDGFMAGYWNSPELTFVSGTTVTKGWAETLARYKARYDTPEKRGRLAFSDLDVEVLGPDAAVVFGRWKVMGAKPGQGVFTLTFRKVDGRWVVANDRTS